MIKFREKTRLTFATRESSFQDNPAGRLHCIKGCSRNWQSGTASSGAFNFSYRLIQNFPARRKIRFINSVGVLTGQHSKLSDPEDESPSPALASWYRPLCRLIINTENITPVCT